MKINILSKLNCKRPVLKVCLGSICYSRAMICAKYSEKDVLVKPLGNQNKCIPTLEENGEKILNTAAISYYLSSSGLRGGPSEYHQAEVLQWVDWCEGTFRIAVGCWFEFCSENLEKSRRQDTESHLQGLSNLLNYLDRVFLDLTFLVNERISLADITLFSLLLPIYQTKMGPNMLKTYVNLNRWLRTIHNQTQVKAALEEKSLSSALASEENKPQKDHVSGSELNKNDRKTPEATKVFSSEKEAITSSALDDQDQTIKPDNKNSKIESKPPGKEPETKSEVKEPSLVPSPTSPQQSEQAASGRSDTSQGNDQQKKKKNKNKKNKSKK
ncbi:Elongation factor 1-gamma [Frankliniella fusca]|uniref:Elongation factor 1-gamma n=1 Tax=Frankliniella fusca TaxID=407009 RepID=A0AAE1GTT4_9NEOP|nr:Elongation factor 1-gamma [Frankliniella fusca]